MEEEEEVGTTEGSTEVKRSRWSLSSSSADQSAEDPKSIAVFSSHWRRS